MKKYKGLSNIEILKKYIAGERPFITTGYEGSSKYHEEGTSWKDSKNIEWKRENGQNIKLTKTQGDIIREAIGKGLDCRKCGASHKWMGKHDLKFLHRTGLCANCLIDYETKLRIVGVYPDYEAYKMLSYELGAIQDIKEKLKEVIKFFTKDSGDIEMICNSEGFIERWKHNNPTEILDNAKRDLKLSKTRITFLSKAKNEAKKKYLAGATKFKLETYV